MNINLELTSPTGSIMYLTADVDFAYDAEIPGSRDEEPAPESYELLSVWACNHDLTEFVDDAPIIEKLMDAKEDLESDYGYDDD